MATIPIELPQVGESVVEGIIDRWLKKPGDKVQKYEPLVEVVTDKINLEVPSPFNGVLVRILAAEGATVPMGAVIAEIDTDEVAAAPAREETKKGGAAVAPSKLAPQASTIGYMVQDTGHLGPSGGLIEEPPLPSAPPPVAAPTDRFYSPVVMKLAQEHNVDLTQVKGTGLSNRVTKKDVLRHIEERSKAPAAVQAPPVAAAPATVAPPQKAAPPGHDEEEITPSAVRRIIAENMVKSASQIPHAWGMVEADVTNAIRLREALRADFQKREGVDLTLLPFVIKAVVESLKETPLLNSTWRDNKIILKKRLHIGVAVATPNGLMVPVIHDADSLSLSALNKALRALADRARQGKLTLQDVQGGTFTVNNTGALGTIMSKPIINYPQAAILTTEGIQKRPVVINDAIAIRSMMNLCLSFDHRITDGAEASAFLQAVKHRLERIGPDTPLY